MTTASIESIQIQRLVERVVAAQPVDDMHTHLYPPRFGTPVPNAAGQVDSTGLMLWGIDELVTYHYLVAEVFRVVPATRLPYEQFWKMTKPQQADHVWKHLFVERTPLSEACRGVLTTLQKLGLDPNESSLDAYRPFFNQQKPNQYIDRVMEIANVSCITMTNAVFDDNERDRWLSNPGIGFDSRFRGALRIDPLIRSWPAAARKLKSWGYQVDEQGTAESMDETRRFLGDWIERLNAACLAVSLPPEFAFPVAENDTAVHLGQRILQQAILPTCSDRNLPLALMIGSRLGVNPELRDAGDMCGKANISAVTNLCRDFPGNKFLVTMLARENQHELCVAARKFGNLMIFGCWWFLNNPSLIEEIQRMRFELLGTSFIPQHSDARVFEQLIYKWDHSRQILVRVLTEKYIDLMKTGRQVAEAQISADVKRLFSDNFTEFRTRN